MALSSSIYPFMIGKKLRFTVFRLLGNAFVKLPCPYHDLIINPPCRTVPQQICPKQFVPHLPWKASLHTLWGEALSLCSIWKSCESVSLNICKKVQNKTCKHIEFGKKDCKTEKVSEFTHYIRIGVFSFKTPQGTPLRFLTSSSRFFFSSSLNSNKTTVINIRSMNLSP